MALADDISVIKDGQLMATLPAAEATVERIVRLMVGRELSDFYPPAAANPPGAEVFAVEQGGNEPLAFLPERFMPPYYLNGRDFLKYILKLQGLPYQEAPALEMLAALDLDAAALSRPVRAYSKGMTQKLGL
eukprot:gene57205-76391_t